MDAPCILFVDDDAELLAAYERTFRKRYRVATAPDGPQALELLRGRGDVAVVVADLRMPDMDGIDFLDQVRRASPDTVRIMLTGYADAESAAAAVNRGKVFSFLTKPCPEEELARALDGALRQHRLVVAERELLRGTVRGSIKLLTGLLAQVNPEAFGKSGRVRRLAVDMARYMEASDIWRVELAAMLSQIGCASLPAEALQRVYRGEELPPELAAQYSDHPRVGRELLANIPRLKEVAEAVGCQALPYDGAGPDAVKGAPAGEDIPLAGRILKVALDYDTLETGGAAPQQALEAMRGRKGAYDPEVLGVLDSMLNFPEGYERRSVTLSQLKPGMLLDQELCAGEEPLVRGLEVNQAVLQRLRAAARAGDFPSRRRIRVLVPPDDKLLYAKLMEL